MLILAQHVRNSRWWEPDQFIPGFPLGLAHGQFIQVRNHICMGAFDPLTWDVLWGVIPTAHGTAFHNPCTCHANESLHQQGDLGGKAFTIRSPVPAICGFPNALEHTGVSLQPLLHTSSMPCCVLIQELPNV